MGGGLSGCRCGRECSCSHTMDEVVRDRQSDSLSPTALHRPSGLRQSSVAMARANPAASSRSRRCVFLASPSPRHARRSVTSPRAERVTHMLDRLTPLRRTYTISRHRAIALDGMTPRSRVAAGQPSMELRRTGGIDALARLSGLTIALLLAAPAAAEDWHFSGRRSRTSHARPTRPTSHPSSPRSLRTATEAIGP
jgi:hypothetical protein